MVPAVASVDLVAPALIAVLGRMHIHASPDRQLHLRVLEELFPIKMSRNLLKGGLSQRKVRRSKLREPIYPDHGGV